MPSLSFHDVVTGSIHQRCRLRKCLTTSSMSLLVISRGWASRRWAVGDGAIGIGSDSLIWPRGDGYIWPHRFELAGGLVLV